MANKLEVVLSVVDEGFDVFKKASKEVDNLTNSTNTFANAAKIGGKVVGAAFAVVTAAVAGATAAYAGIIKPAMEMADTLQKQADIAGVSTTALQQYSYAAKQAGSSAESMTTGLSKLTENAYNAYAGNKKLAEGFQVLGVNLRDANGNFRNTNDIVNETIGKLADLENPAQQSALAVQLLGKGGRDLVPMLRGGSGAINEMRNEAVELGQVLSEDAIKNLDKMGDNLDMLGNKLKVQLAEAVNLAMPSLELFADGLSKIINKASEVAIGIGWMLGGEKKFNEEMAAQNAITRELQDMIALKKEYESIIGAQEAFKRHQSDLFDEETLVSYQAALENLKADIANFNKPKTDTGSGKQGAPTGLGGGGDEKADKDALKKLKSAYTSDYDALGEDAKAKFLIDQRVAKERMEAQEKINKEMLANQKKTNAQKVKNDEDANRALKIGMQKLHAEEKALAEAKRQRDIANAREQLSILTGVLQEAASRSKAAAVAYKTLAIAQTIIDTYKGAQASYTAMAGIGPIGPALGFIAAAAAVAAGMMRVNEIRKQQFASGGISQGGYATVGEMGPELVNLPAGTQVINHHNTQQMINNQSRGHTLNVTVMNDGGSVSQRFVRELRDGTADYAVKQLLRKTRSLGLASA